MAVCLGRGNCSAVYAGTYRGRAVAVKMFTENDADRDGRDGGATAALFSVNSPLKACVGVPLDVVMGERLAATYLRVHR